MTKLTILSGVSLVICIVCLLVVYLWPTRDWMGGPLIGMFLYLPLIIIEGVLLFLCIVLEQRRRLIVTAQGVVAVACLALLVYYVINHPQ